MQSLPVYKLSNSFKQWFKKYKISKIVRLSRNSRLDLPLKRLLAIAPQGTMGFSTPAVFLPMANGSQSPGKSEYIYFLINISNLNRQFLQFQTFQAGTIYCQKNRCKSAMFWSGSLVQVFIWLMQLFFPPSADQCLLLKFMIFKKATKMMKSSPSIWLCSKCQIDGEDFINFCGLLRKHKLYWKSLHLFSIGYL